MSVVSVIIPVYKAEKFLRRCLDSLIAQTFIDWQAICIDDGSPDRSPAILDEYAARDTRIKVIHRANAGVSSARNLGIENADGEYIHFLDADDWIDPEYYQAMVTVANDSGADMVVSGFVSDNKYTKHIVYKNVRLVRGMLDKLRLTYALTDSYVWRYLFKTDFVREKNLVFDTNLIAQEDTLFVLNAIAQAGMVVSVPWVNYHYMFNENSALNSRDAAHRARVKAQYKIGKKYRRDFAKAHRVMYLWRLKKIINFFR
ncbi:MAG: glycosyltransferase family 2 protein [Alphaproteobacteria bacterium]|nr:glycosyltransferase family 2 protein [Alphaproteobacteria bacterium]